MLAKYLLLLGFFAIVHAADILTYKIMDFQGSMLQLTSIGSNSLVPVESVKNAKGKGLNWNFIYAARGNPNEYSITNKDGPSILSYTTASMMNPSSALHAQIVGNQNVGTFWILEFLDRNGTISFTEKTSGLAITAWPAGKGSQYSPLTLEKYDTKNPQQVFKLIDLSA
ncbi:hypothetical protein MSAN_02212500 [Mycena sanguinolenta]|uniref:Ricin B lectin domain-containing protein n=1 Tax=Mycena sanguinolenta TaxID=230812 RepID=A0A8H7CKP9_9AGAR|nr:hypothetical protein MSAN_02212500 [Mycena sanguinolenta]